MDSDLKCVSIISGKRPRISDISILFGDDNTYITYGNNIFFLINVDSDSRSFYLMDTYLNCLPYFLV